MTVPLIILGVASTIGWLINAPFGGLDFLNKWLAPVFPATIAPAFQVATGTKWVIGADGDGGVVHRPDRRAAACGGAPPTSPELEPAVLAHGWYIDEGVAATVSGPADAGWPATSASASTSASSTAPSTGWPA